MITTKNTNMRAKKKCNNFSNSYSCFIPICIHRGIF